MKPYDMVREGLMVFAAITVVVCLLAFFYGFPDYHPLTPKEVAHKEPVAFLKRTVSYFSGTSGLQTYGPPYTNNYANAQHVGPICPDCWFGVVTPLNAKVDLVMQPLQQIGMLNPAVAKELQRYQQAPAAQQAKWDNAYTSALDKATVSNGQVQLPPGQYGPVPQLMTAMLNLAKAGMLDGVLSEDTNPKLAPYNTSYARALLYLGGPIMNQVSKHMDEQGGQWGMSHMEGPYPGAWWLWPYAFVYQLPPVANSPNADLIAGLTMFAIGLVLILLPFIPGLNRIHLLIPIYKIIWRDWYAKYPSGDPAHPAPTAFIDERKAALSTR